MKVTILSSIFVLICNLSHAGFFMANNYYETKNVQEVKRSDYESFDYGARLELPLLVLNNGTEIRIDPQYTFESDETRVYATMRIPINKLWQKE